jgi:hypothetical protein
MYCVAYTRRSVESTRRPFRQAQGSEGFLALLEHAERCSSAGLAGVHGNELVLSPTWRDHEQPAHWTIPRVPDCVGGTVRHDDECASGQLKLGVAELKSGFSVSDIEHLVGVRVKVQRRAGFARRERSDFNNVGPSHL